jgi:hypothetical protein
MSVTLAAVTFDCSDAAGLARFWAGVLEQPVDPNASDHFATIGMGVLQPAWMFIQVPEGKQVKNRLHVDFHSPDWSAEADRVVALGAKRLGDFDEFGTQWATLMDPEDNEFDIGKGMS